MTSNSAEQSAEKIKSSILIVDDTPNNLRFLSSMLIEEGYEVRKAVNGQMALRSIQAELPDLVLLDIRMPDMSGYEVCQQLKSQPETREIPVIFLSALDEEKDKVTAFDVGGVDYISKPLHLQEVLARVRTHLTLQQQQQQLIEQNQKLQQEVKARAEAELALQKANQALQRLANLDGVTHIANRRRFDEYLHLQWQQALASQQSLAMILCEIDGLEHYEATKGSDAANERLRAVAWAMNRLAKPPVDLAARYSDARFAVLLPGKINTEAVEIAEQIRQDAQQLKGHQSIALSLGVSSLIPVEGAELSRLVDQADQALHQSLSQGGDRVTLFH
ncbi:MAG: response regulator [Microcoleaceae cyanobacterium]